MNEAKGVRIDDDEPCYVISVAAKLVGVHAQTLRYYERAGLLKPSRPTGKIRLYSPADIARGRQIKELMDDTGVNLAGVEIILNNKARHAEVEEELSTLRQEVTQLKQALSAKSGRDTPAAASGSDESATNDEPPAR